MLLRCLAAGMLCSLALNAADISLIRVGEIWRYFPGVMEASAPVTAWRQAAFDDALWLASPSGFCNRSTYYQEATVVMGYPSAVYLRKKFEVAQPEEMVWLTMRVDYQDGFVAYLNGTEVARRGFANEPGAFVPFDAVPMSHPGGAAEEIDLTAFKPLLLKGENILAIQGHQNFFYGLILTPELLANFTRAPFLQALSSNQVQIIWKTPVPADSLVRYGTNDLSESQSAATNQVTTHVATLSNLIPNSAYHYQVLSSANGQQVQSPVFSFRTFPTGGPSRFVVVADTGWGGIPQHHIAEVMRQASPDFVMVVGDVVYPTFTSGRVDLRCFSVYQPQMSRIPFFFAIGNHDRYSNYTDFGDAFYFPTNGIPGAGYFYSFDHGDAHFVVLDTDLNVGVGVGVGPGTPQYQWLEADLRATTQPWKFLFFHNPLRSSGPHRYDNYNLNHDASGWPLYDRDEFQSTIGALAARYGVQATFHGHEHYYERHAPVDGVHTVISGGGGAVLYGMGTRDEASSQCISDYHCVLVNVDSNRLELSALNISGQVFDSLSISRQPPPRQFSQAAWHSPVLDATAASDGDGNLQNQRFWFTNEPIYSRSGSLANLGRLFANNDAFNLYLGLDRVMIHSDQLIFLFLEVPGLTGVITLSGLGNVVVDPAGQGVDGLDFLENLSFTNFQPSVVALLGDEYADEQARSFARPGMDLNTGQGLFRLNAGLDDVSGAYIQQFNHSPQWGIGLAEQNADFIQLSIPLASLGKLKPGDPIKVGVIAAGQRHAGTNLPPHLEIDPGYIGYSLGWNEAGAAFLEGVEINLAPQTDADGDGLPDGWEAQFGLNPASDAGDDGANGDPDNDGLSNLQEQTAGTDPKALNSILRLGVEPLPGGSIRLSWPATPGRRYQLEYSDHSPFNFQNLQPAIYPKYMDAPTMIHVDDLSNAPSPPVSRFYRVRLLVD